MHQETKAVLCEIRGDVTIVHFAHAKITEPLYVEAAAAELKRIARVVGGKILLDLSNVQFIGPAGLSELLIFNRNVRALGGHVRVCGVSPLLMRGFTSCRLDAVVEIHATQAEALLAFHGGCHALQGSVA